MKQITITIPDNCELKQDGNTYIIVEKKKLTYEDIARELFKDKLIHCINDIGDFSEFYNDEDNGWNYPWNATSKLQLEKLLAINKLMNVAKYLNGDWQPDWNNEEGKYYISLEHINNDLFIDCIGIFQKVDIYFKSEELAEQAIEILGEETIKIALCTDY